MFEGADSERVVGGRLIKDTSSLTELSETGTFRPSLFSPFFSHPMASMNVHCGECWLA